MKSPDVVVNIVGNLVLVDEFTAVTLNSALLLIVEVVGIVGVNTTFTVVAELLVIVA